MSGRCAHCRAPLDELANFCPRCGARRGDRTPGDAMTPRPARGPRRRRTFWLAALAAPAMWGAVRFDQTRSHWIDWGGSHHFAAGEVAQLRGRFRFGGDGNLYATVHNDTDLTVRRLRVRVHFDQAGAANTVDQTYEFEGVIRAHADEQVRARALFEPAARQPWRAEIVGAQGDHRPW